ncbi:hypothetical protein [Cypionkella sp.]|uniref:hypothetical protein n=1 Tax=Cypionkella sp. TaxID=2811411 RepID=UPI00262C90FC|nr:hypothetical protein [Cypionkella sp.]
MFFPATCDFTATAAASDFFATRAVFAAADFAVTLPAAVFDFNVFGAGSALADFVTIQNSPIGAYLETDIEDYRLTRNQYLHFILKPSCQSEKTQGREFALAPLLIF